jgi:hypothetical protein
MNPLFPLNAWWLSAVLLVLSLACSRSQAAAASGRVDVILWFDTEDYLLPADDDACKRLAEMLTERGIRATFKVVGEKARVLEKRGRTDVIAALKKHAIGYHANFHSVHPTPSEYLADCRLLDGVSEFVRREGRGAADVRRVFGVETLACYGQPGSSWGAQAIAGLPEIGVAPHGIPCYVDEGDHVGLNEQPFWYAGALIVYHMGRNYTRMELHDPAAVEPAEKKFAAIAERLREKGGGLISIFYHPCEWVHQEFWDGVNFRRGANPPREQWKAPPQRPPADTEAAFERFGQYIDYIQSIPNVRFVTASDLPTVYPDAARTIGASEKDLEGMATRLTSGQEQGVDFWTTENRAFSAADQFELLARATAAAMSGAQPQFPLKASGLLGPDGPAPVPSEVRHIPWLAFRDTLRDVVDYLNVEHRIPARVFVGADAVSPADFLVGVASVWAGYAKSGTLPTATAVDLGQAVELLPARHVAQDTPGLFGGWIIHKEGFRAPHILEVARWQAWTLKPAIRGE